MSWGFPSAGEIAGSRGRGRTRREARTTRRQRRGPSARSLPTTRRASSPARYRRVRLRAFLRDRRSPRGSRRRSAGLPRGPLCGSAPRLRIRDTSSRLARALRRGDRRSPSSARERGTLTKASVFDLARLAEELEAPPPPGFEALRALAEDFSELPKAPIPAAPPRTAPRLSEEGS